MEMGDRARAGLASFMKKEGAAAPHTFPVAAAVLPSGHMREVSGPQVRPGEQDDLEKGGARSPNGGALQAPQTTHAKTGFATGWSPK
jgi:hypothetical protein